jgi:hypothetical protein
MTGPETLALLKTISTILSMVGTWPLGLCLVVIFLGPWAVMLWISRSLEKQAAQHDLETVMLIDSIKEGITASLHVYEVRHQEAVQMYKDNVELVKGYSNLAMEQATVIRLNTTALTRLVDRIDAANAAKGLKNHGD